MNTRDEIIDALEGRRGEAAPPAIFTQTGTVAQMDACGACWPEAHFDADKMATLAMQPAEMFGFATAKVPFSITTMPKMLGCETDIGTKDKHPAVTGSPWRNDDMVMPEVPDFPSPDEFVEMEGLRVIMDAARKIRSRREDLFVITGMEDPSTAVYQSVGLETFLMAGMMDPDLCKRWISAVSPCVRRYAEVLSEVSDDIQIIVDASTDIMPPELFTDIIMDDMAATIRSVKCPFSTVHCCGSTTEVLEHLASMGETGLSVESFGDYEGVVERTRGKVRLIGGVPPVAHLFQGTPKDIVGDAWKASDAGYDIIAPECGVPPLTPNENLQALASYRKCR